jgi:hypothetical protein
MKFSIQAPHIIPEVLSKWRIQLLHILVAIAFLALQGLNFSNLFMHASGPTRAARND